MIPIQNIKNNNNKRSIHKNIQNSEYLKKKMVPQGTRTLDLYVINPTLYLLKYETFLLLKKFQNKCLFFKFLPLKIHNISFLFMTIKILKFIFLHNFSRLYIPLREDEQKTLGMP